MDGEGENVAQVCCVYSKEGSEGGRNTEKRQQRSGKKKE